jgi:hypothetical protein
MTVEQFRIVGRLIGCENALVAHRRVALGALRSAFGEREQRWSAKADGDLAAKPAIRPAPDPPTAGLRARA